jgi:hypothetical protein
MVADDGHRLFFDLDDLDLNVVRTDDIRDADTSPPLVEPMSSWTFTVGGASEAVTIL